MKTWGKAFSTFELEILDVASAENTVLVERVDIFKRDNGSTFLALPVAGVAEFHDGKITNGASTTKRGRTRAWQLTTPNQNEEKRCSTKKYSARS